MGRKVGLAAAVLMIAVLSAGLVGGQVGDGGFLWWGTREPIYIYGNGDFTVENGVMSGRGTAADPYIIEGWRIDAPKADYGVTIDHTTAHFVIRDCVIERVLRRGSFSLSLCFWIRFPVKREGCCAGKWFGCACFEQFQPQGLVLTVMGAARYRRTCILRARNCANANSLQTLTFLLLLITFCDCRKEVKRLHFNRFRLSGAVCDISSSFAPLCV